jgi:glycosyltransferase involved in cell wall biosynthesis
LKILRSSDAYVSASEHDGWSVSILESLAVGTPVIVSNIDPNKDLLDSGIHGVLFENRDPVSLCTKIEQLIKESRTTKNVENRRISGRKKIEEFCDLGSNLKNLSHLLESTFLERNS